MVFIRSAKRKGFEPISAKAPASERQAMASFATHGPSRLNALSRMDSRALRPFFSQKGMARHGRPHLEAVSLRPISWPEGRLRRWVLRSSRPLRASPPRYSAAPALAPLVPAASAYLTSKMRGRRSLSGPEPEGKVITRPSLGASFHEM